MNDWKEILKLVDDFKGHFNQEKIQHLAEDNQLREFIREAPMDLDYIFREDEYWPCARNVGVYFIFNTKEELLYIGKASADSSIGMRLSDYFKKDPDADGKWVDVSGRSWKGPQHVAAVGVDNMNNKDGLAWIAPALEEFLLSRFDEKRLLENQQLRKTQ